MSEQQPPVTAALGAGGSPAPASSPPPQAPGAAGSPADADAQRPQDPAEQMRARGRSPELAAFLAWLIPGLGHVYAGYPLKGLLSLVMLLGMWITGISLSRGEAVSLDSEEGHPYAFVAQIGCGLPTGLAVLRSKGMLPGVAPPARDPGYRADPEWIARLPDQDTGLLFTMVAGLLNLLLVYDALQGVPGAIARRAEEARTRRRIEALRQELAAKAAGEPSPVTEELPTASPGAATTSGGGGSAAEERPSA